MTSLTESISSIAIWGSLIASLVLGCFMVVQALIDRERRGSFIAFAFVCFVVLTLDLLFPIIDKFTYEFARVFCWAFYGPVVLLLFTSKVRQSVATACAIIIVGLCCWFFVDRDIATTCVLPLSFAVAAAAHFQFYRRSQGYASCVLSATSACQAVMCALFYPTVMLHNQVFNAIGYAHYGTISICAVVFGWVHLPREMRGRAPVTVSPVVATAFTGVFCGAEAAILPSLHILPVASAPHVAIGAALVQFGALVTLFLYHRHLLVEHTDNVTALLDERTASLRKAQADLARQNEVQAVRLDDQARSLKEQSDVIERQRRLELAAQTAGQAAHDIQNLISPLVTYLDLIERSDYSMLSPAEVSRRMRGSVDELRELNGQLLALARRGQVAQNPLDLRELLTELRERFSALDVAVDVESSLWVRGSWSQLGRAVTNLVINAHEACPNRPVLVSGSRVAVLEAKRCHLGYLQPGSYIALQVRDEGGGISSDVIDRIFEPFFSSKTRSDQSGSGLGLSIVAAVVDDHRGILDLDTGVHGTTFTIYLPLLDDEIRSSEDPVTGDGTILIVDDDVRLLSRMKDELSDLGFEVACARTGREAVRLVQAEQFDLIVVDMAMPEMDGAETTFALRHLRPESRIIIHSSFVAADKAASVMAMGALAILAKPATASEIIRTWRDAADSSGSIAA